MKEHDYTKQLWCREEYRVLLHSQQSYQMIRDVLKADLSLHQVQQMIDVALLIEPSIESVCNAFNHMWEYLKKCANEEERQQSKLLEVDFINGKIGTQTLLDFLAELTNRYNVQYLLQSRVLNTERKRQIETLVITDK